MVLKRGKSGFNSGATVRMSGLKKLTSRLAAEQHAIVVNKSPAKKPNTLKKKGVVIDLNDKIKLDDGNLDGESTGHEIYSMNKKKRWDLPEVVKSYIFNHQEDNSRVVLFKREAMITPMEHSSFGVNSKQSDCTFYHDSKAGFPNSLPARTTRASTKTDLLKKALSFDADELRKEVKYPRRMIHNQHARGVQRPIHHPAGGYSNAKKEAIKEHLQKWQEEHCQKLDDDYDTVSYEVLEPKVASVEQHHWLHKHTQSANRARTNVRGPFSWPYRARHSGVKLEQNWYIDDSRDYKGIEANPYGMVDDWSYLDEDESDGCFDEQLEDEGYIAKRRTQSAGDALFDLISSALEKKFEEALARDVTVRDIEPMELEESTEDTGSTGAKFTKPEFESCTDNHANSSMALPKRNYPIVSKKRRKNGKDKNRNKSGDSQDSGIGLEYHKNSESPEIKVAGRVHEVPSNSYRYLEPDCVKCSIPFSNIQSTFLSKTFGDLYQEGQSVPRKFSIEVPASIIGRYSAEVCLIFEEMEDAECGILDFNSWNELEELYAKMRFQVIGNIADSALASIREGLNEALDTYSHISLESLMDKVTQAVTQEGLESFRCLGPAIAYRKNPLKKEYRFQTTCTVNGWKRKILDEVEINSLHREVQSFPSNDISNFASIQIDTDTCGICYTTIKGDDVVPSTTLKTCSHVFCNECWSNHLRSRICLGYAQLTCPGYKCTANVDETTLMSLVPWKLYKFHIQHLREMHIDCNKRLNWCPGKKCQHLVKSAGKSVKKGHGENIVCLCGDVWCFKCQQAPHWPATCEQYVKYTKHLKERGLDKTISDIEHMVSGKRCPNCQHPIEKNGGCPNMHCSRCNESFCWTCGKSWKHHTYPCYAIENEAFSLIDHLPGRQQFFLMAIMARLKRKSPFTTRKDDNYKKTHGLSCYQVLRKFRGTSSYQQTKALWEELLYAVEYSNVVLYFANKKLRSKTISGRLYCIDNLAEGLKELLTCYTRRLCSLKQYDERLERMKRRANLVLRYLKMKAINQQGLIVLQGISHLRELKDN